MAEISIIIPVYNAENYIHRCLNSLLSQTFDDFECILVNDGSKDRSREICEAYCRQDRRFTLLNKENGGAASARNLGLDWYYEHSACPWMCFIDIDDFIHEKYLETLYRSAREQKARISMCSYVITDHFDFPDDLAQNSEPWERVQMVDTEQLWCERQINCTIPWAKLFWREVFGEIRYPEGIIHEDEFTLYKVMFRCEKIAYCDMPLYGYYQTQTSVMRGKWTPRHMVEPDGIYAQLTFFQQNHYDQATAYTARIYLNSIYRNLISARECGEVYREYVEKLHDRLRKELPRCAKTAGVSIKSESWFYYEAYPIATIPYRLLTKILK